VGFKETFGHNPPYRYINTSGTKKAVSRLSFLLVKNKKGADDI
jgi:hypothetical protein